MILKAASAAAGQDLLHVGVVAAEPKLCQQAFDGERQGAVDGAAAGALVSAAAEGFGNSRHVYQAFAAQADAIAPIRLFAEEQRYFDALNRERVIHQAFTIFVAGLAALHGPTIHMHPRQAALTLQSVKRRPEQTHLRELRREVDVVRDAHRIGAAAHQFLRQREGTFGGSVEAERTGVGQHRGVEAGSDLRGNLDPGFTRQPEDHFRRRAGVGIDPVYVAKGTRRRVVIDVDEKVPLETRQARALHAVALQNNGSVGIGSLVGVAQDRIAERQRPINAGHAIAQHYARLLAHAAQDLRASQRRTNSIAIRPRVRGQNERLASTDLVQYFVQHGY